MANGEVLERDDCVLYRVTASAAMLSGTHVRDLSNVTACIAAVEWGRDEFGEQPWNIWLSAAIHDNRLSKALRAANLVDIGISPAMLLAQPVEVPPAPFATEILTMPTTRMWRDFWAVCERSFDETDFSAPLRQIFGSDVNAARALGLHPVVGYDADQNPVGAALTLESGEVAGLYWVGVAAHARRQGVGARCSAVAIAGAQSRGARSVILQSSADGLHVYQDLGFCHLLDYSCWVRRAA
jgi:GNAT superfamily N-acetyltransferase